MKRIATYLIVLTVFLVGCKKPIPAPEAAILVAPEDNVSCLYVPVNTSTANVVFSWQEALNTDSYILNIRNESTGIETSTTTENTSLRLTLSRGVIYQWKVVSISDASDEETESNTRYFFLEAQQQSSHLPFPARLLNPQADEIIQLSNGNASFSWEGADLDNDIASYTLLLGLDENSLQEIVTNHTPSSFTTALEAETSYYWQVVTIDSEGSRSNSDRRYFETAP